jgi:hypothetical protein
MSRPKKQTTLIRERMLQREGMVEDKTQPPRSRFRPITPDRLKTPSMLLKELEFNMDIDTILRSGPLGHNNHSECGVCIECRYGIDKSTASKWRKRLHIPQYRGPLL